MSMNAVSDPPTVSVVVVNWNGRAYLDTCFEALAAQDLDGGFEVVLVDNGSTDGSVHHVRRKFPHIRVVEAGRNIGFSAGCNLGLRAGQGRYLATLDNDTRVRPGWLRALVRAMESEPGIGVADSKVLFQDHPGVINSAGLTILSDGRVVGRGFRQADIGQFNTRTEVFGAPTTAAIFSREMLADVGLLDESYIAYLDDADLAWRMRQLGWKAVYEPTAVVEHVFTGTGSRNPERLLFLVNRNRLFTVFKNGSREMIWRVLRHLNFDAGANVRMWLVKLGVMASLARHAPHLIAERRHISKRSRVGKLEVESWFTPASEWERIWNAQTTPQRNDPFLPSELMPWLL